MPAIPQNLAGTIMGFGGPAPVVLSDDDYAAWHAAGWTVCPMHCQCSERIADDGEKLVAAGPIWAAVDTHGASLDDIGAMMRSAFVDEAVGVFHGETLGAALVKLPYGGREDAREVVVKRAHRALQAGLPGFQCFAVLTLDDSRPVLLGEQFPQS